MDQHPHFATIETEVKREIKILIKQFKQAS